jgi:hypothetical protein
MMTPPPLPPPVGKGDKVIRPARESNQISLSLSFSLSLSLSLFPCLNLSLSPSLSLSLSLSLLRSSSAFSCHYCRLPFLQGVVYTAGGGKTEDANLS